MNPAKLLTDDPKRGERFAAEGAGLYLGTIEGGSPGGPSSICRRKQYRS